MGIILTVVAPPGSLMCQAASRARPCLSFPVHRWACSPYLLLCTRDRPPLASSPPHHGTGGAAPRGQRAAGRARERRHRVMERKVRGGPGNRWGRAGLGRARQAKPSFPEQSR